MMSEVGGTKSEASPPTGTREPSMFTQVPRMLRMKLSGRTPAMALRSSKRLARRAAVAIRGTTPVYRMRMGYAPR